MNADENIDQHVKKAGNKSPESEYRTPLQTPSSVADTPVPRRFADFTFSSNSDDSTLSNTPLDPKLVEELLGSDSSGKSINDSFNVSYSPLSSSGKGSGTESTLAMSPKISLAESYVFDANRSKDELNQGHLFDISTEQTDNFTKDDHNSEQNATQNGDSVGDTVKHTRDDCESKASSCSTSKDVKNPETDKENSVSTQAHPSETPTGFLGSFKELCETLPPRSELTKRSRFETSIDTNKSFFNEVVVEKTFFRDLEGPEYKPETSSFVKSDEVHLSNCGQLSSLSNTGNSSTVDREISSSPNEKGLKEDASTYGEFKKVLKTFFSFSKGKKSDERVLDESIKIKNNDSQMAIGCNKEQTCVGSPRNSSDASSSSVFDERLRIQRSFSPVIADENSNNPEPESFGENILISNHGVKRKNETLDSPSETNSIKMDVDLAIDFDRDLFLGAKQNTASSKKATHTPSNIFTLSFNAEELRKEQKRKEERELKLLRQVQELKTRRILTKEPSYARILANIKVEPTFDETLQLEQESIYNWKASTKVNTRDFVEPERRYTTLSEVVESKTKLIACDEPKVEDNQLHDQAPSFKSQPLVESGDVLHTHSSNESNLNEGLKTRKFVFSDPIINCIENIKDSLCSREEEMMVSPSENSQPKTDLPVESTEVKDKPQGDISYLKHTCEKFLNLSPLKDADVKKNRLKNAKALEMGTCPMDLTSENVNQESPDIQFDKSIAKGVMKALKDMKTKNGVILAQIQKFVVQQKLVRVDSKLDKEIERFLETAEELGIVTKKGSRFYPQIKVTLAPKTKKVVEPKQKATSVQQKPAPRIKKVAVKVSTPSSKRLEMYRQKVINSPTPLLNLRSRRRLPTENIKMEIKEVRTVRRLRSRDIMVGLKSNPTL